VSDPVSASAPAAARERLGLGAVTVLLAGLTAATPLLSGETPLRLVGALLVLAGALELLHGLRRVGPDAQRSAFRSGAFTLGMGLLVLAAPALVGSAVVLFLAASFFVDGLRWLAELGRLRRLGQATLRAALAAAGNMAVAGLLGLFWNTSARWIVALAGALRILGAGWTMITAPVHALGDASATVSDALGLADQPGAVELAERLVDDERRRRPIDRRWIVAFATTLFAIHVGRMEAEWTLVGLLGPFVAVLGDLLVALLLAVGVIAPARLGLRTLARPVERRAWPRLAAATGATPAWTDRLLRAWLSRSLRISIRARQSRYSLAFALEQGLQAHRR
jgi:hypothetical protein